MSKVGTEPVEQLWYTWSTRGLDEIPAGFRVRAASPGLMAIYGRRVDQLSRYMRYSLPPGSDYLNTPPESAPVCLAYVRTEDERALVHKVYTGRDGRNRPGAYFIHLLAGLEGFSAMNAIALWRSPFWYVADSTEGTQLAPTSLQDIKEKFGPDSLEVRFQDVAALRRQFRGVTILRPLEEAKTEEERERIARMRKYLGFLIHAYLLQQDKLERREPEIQELVGKLQQLEEELKERKGLMAWSRSARSVKEIQQDIEELEAKSQVARATEPPRICIAAPPDEVAYLIAALVRVMPAKFLEDITFSVYEHDVSSKLPLRIIGTCPPSVALDSRSMQADILPFSCYINDLALNTYQPKCSTLADIRPEDPAIPSHLAILDTYVDDATAAIETGDFEELDEFFKDIAGIANTREFLRRYYYLVITAKWLSLRALTDIFSDPALAKVMLKKKRVRDQIFQRSYRDDPSPVAPAEGEQKESRQEHLQWLNKTLPPLAANLRAWCKQNTAANPGDADWLNEALDMVEQDAFTHLILQASNKDYAFFITIHALLAALSPLNPGSSRWIGVLTRLNEDQQHLSQPNVRDLLLDDACCILTPGDRDHESIIAPLLRVSSPEDFGRLLAPSSSSDRGKALTSTGALRLPSAWSLLATLNFVAACRTGAWLNTATVRQLEPYSSQLQTLTRQLLQHRETPTWWNIAGELFAELARCDYYFKMALLEIWLAQPLDGKYLKTILSAARLSRSELEHILEIYGAKYLLHEDTAPVINTHFSSLAGQLSPDRKQALVSQIMDGLLSLDNTRVSKEWIGAFLKTANLTTEECRAVIEQFAPRILAWPTLAGLAADLYSEIIAVPEGRQYRIPLLYRVCSLRPPDLVVDELLRQASLSDSEALRFFESYGTGNFAFCYRSPVARALYARLVAQYPRIKTYLFSWLSHKLTAEEERELLSATAPMLTQQDATSILTNYGKKLFSHNPTFELLFDLTRQHLQTLPEAAFRHATADQQFLLFLKEQHERYLPNDLKEQVNNWYKLWEFIEYPSCQQSRVQEVVRIIYNDSLSSPIIPLAEALATCIDNAIQLSAVITTMYYIGETEVARLLEHMTACIRAQLKVRSPDHDRWQQRACAYLQCACETDEDALPGAQRVIDTLLQEDSRLFLAFVNKQAVGWSPIGSARWKNERSRFHPLSSLSEASAPAASEPTQTASQQMRQAPAVQPPQPPPAATQTGVLQSAGTALPSKPDNWLWLLPFFLIQTMLFFFTAGIYYFAFLHNLLNFSYIRELPVLPFMSCLLLVLIIVDLCIFPFTRGLLLFPYLTWRFWRIRRRRGTGKRVVFWNKHMRVLLALGNLFPRAWQQEIQFARNFYDLCQIADTRTSMAAEQAILNIINDQKNTPYLDLLSAHERKRVELASNNVNRAMTAPSYRE